MEEEMLDQESPEMMEEEMPAGAAAMGEDMVPVEEPEEAGPGVPAEMKQEIIDGGTALFYTAIQVFGAKSAKDRIKKWLRAGDITMASMFALVEATKKNAQQKLPVTPPMMIAAAPYITAYAQNISEKMGQDVTKADAKRSALEVIDRVIGLYHGAKTSDEHDRQAAMMARQQSQPPGAQSGGAGMEMPQQGGMM